MKIWMIALGVIVSCSAFGIEATDQTNENSELPAVMVNPAPEDNDSTQAPSKNSAPFKRLDTYYSVGTTLSPTSKYKYDFNGIQSSKTEYDKPSFAFDIDTSFRFTPLIGMSFVGDVIRYKYEDGSSPDLILHFGIGPRVAVQRGPFEVWANVLGGYSINEIGRPSYIEGGYIQYLNDKKLDAFQFSSRLGIDYNLKGIMKFRLQGGYSLAKYDFDIDVKTYPGLNNVGTVKGELQRSFGTLQLGISFSL